MIRRPEGLLTVLQVLESAPKARAHWQEIAGIDYPMIEKWLRPTSEIAALYPCAPGCSANNAREIREWHDPIVAVCRGRRCEKIKLTRDDALGYQVGLAAIGSAVATAFGASPRPPEPTAVWRWWTIGSVSRGAGTTVPVVLSTSISTRETQRGVAELLVAGLAPFALLLTRGRNIEMATIALLRREKCEVVILEEALGLDGAALVARYPIAPSGAVSVAAAPVAALTTPPSPAPTQADLERARIFVEKSSLETGCGSPREGGTVKLVVVNADGAGSAQITKVRRVRFEIIRRLASEPITTVKDSSEDRMLRRLCSENLEPMGLSCQVDSSRSEMRTYSFAKPVAFHEFQGALDTLAEVKRLTRELFRPAC
jgi:hypothetical protein